MPSRVEVGKRKRVLALIDEGHSKASAARIVGIHKHTVAVIVDERVARKSEDGFTREEFDLLKLMVKASDQVVCPGCRKPVISLKSQSTASCHRCGASFTRKVKA